MPRSRRLSRRLPDPAARFRASSRRDQQLELGAGLPTFRAKQADTFTTVASGTFTEILYDQWENGDERVYEEELDGTATFLRIVRLKLRGWYAICPGMGWAVDFNGDVGIDLADGYESSVATWYPRHSGRTNSDRPPPWVISYPIFWPTSVTPTGFPTYVANLLVNAVQYSGVNRVTSVGTELTIAYLGDLTVQEWTAVV